MTGSLVIKVVNTPVKITVRKLTIVKRIKFLMTMIIMMNKQRKRKFRRLMSENTSCCQWWIWFCTVSAGYLKWNWPIRCGNRLLWSKAGS